MERERLPEQRETIAEIARICDEYRVDLVLVAGDVFDTHLPSAEAEEAFFCAMKSLSSNGRAVVVVSGNHDDGVRLAASSPLTGGEGIYLFGGTNVPAMGGMRRVRATEADAFHVVIRTDKGEAVYVNALPYPNEARLREERSEESYAEKAARWIARGDEAYRGDMPHILLSHLFLAGGKASDSERDIDLGGARAVPASVFPATGYVALGHLHRKQACGNIRYSGSILQYAFDEANTEKSVVLLRTEGNDVRVEREIPLTSGKRLVRLEARSAEDGARLIGNYPDCFIELTLHLTAPLTTAETEFLRSANEGLVSLIVRVDAAHAPVVSRNELKRDELFAAYYRSVYGCDPAPELTQTFLRLLEEEE